MAKQQKSVFAFKAYDHKALDQSAAKIVDTAKKKWRYGIWSDSIANRKEYLHNSSFCTRKQRFS